MKSFIPTAAAALVVLAATAATAEPARQRGDRGDRGEMSLLDPNRLDRAARWLELTDEQLVEIRKLVFAARRGHITMEADLELARLELHEMLDADNPTRADVMKQIDKVGQLETQTRKHKIGVLLEVRALLSPEQRTKLETGRHRFREKRGRRRGRGGPPDGPTEP